MTELICPACGSTDVQVISKTQRIQESFGIYEDIESVENVCQICNTTGDFLDSNTSLITETISKLKVKVAISILESLQSEGKSLASMERALNIPQKTFAKWKNSATNPTATGVTLLKFIKLFPWLLEVADSNFDQQKSHQIMLKAASEKWMEYIKNQNYTKESANLNINPETKAINISIDLIRNDISSSSSTLSNVENRIEINKKSLTYA